MSSTVRRIVALAAVGATMGIAGPVGSASAAVPLAPIGGLPTAAGLPGLAPGAGLPGLAPGAGLPAFDAAGLPAFTPPAFTPGSLAFAGPSIGQVAAVIGPTVLTTAPSNFANTNIQVSAGGNLSGGQAGP
jgi:hypothetical protein